jgi:hypothetical protein
VSVKTAHNWVKTLVRLSSAIRREWFFDVIARIRGQRKGSARVWLSDVLEDRSEFHQVGFAVNLSYVMLKGTKTEMPAQFIHAMGSPALLLAHKRLPLVVIASDSLRYDERKGFTG